MTASVRAQRPILWHIVAFALAAALIWQCLQYGLMNFGWLMVARSQPEDARLQSAIWAFRAASDLGLRYSRLQTGLGVALAAVGDEELALEALQLARPAPSWLESMGVQRRGMGQDDLALVYFRALASVEGAIPAAGDVQAWRTCQLARLDSRRLAPANQDYCGKVLSERSGNLLLDGGFDLEPSLAWSGVQYPRNPQMARAEPDRQIGHPAPSLLLVGVEAGRHGGYYQRISLEPGEKVRYSGWFRVSAQDRLSAWLLYVEWRQDGRTVGSYLFDQSDSSDWQHVTREFALPLTAEPWAQFYPVVLSGKGSVWVDSVLVEVLKEEEQGT